MHATLAPHRKQLDPLENHWYSLHFQCPALMRNSARQRHPGCQSGILCFTGNRGKPLAAVTFHVPGKHGAGSTTLCNVFLLVCLRVEVRTLHTGNLQNHWETEHFQASSQERGEQQGTSASRRRGWPEKTAARDLVAICPQS